MKKKNLILDLGGVILTINYHLIIDAFEKAGVPNAIDLYSQQSQVHLFDQLEKGLIGEEEFYDSIRKLAGKPISNELIEKCWNAILIGLPTENIETLYALKKKYRLFLLSNTNAIHERAYRKMIVNQCGSFIFDDIFEKMYLSHHIHLRKPDAEIFNYVLNDAKLDRNETFFVDDSAQHVQGARKTGIDALLMPGNYLLNQLFDIEISS